MPRPPNPQTREARILTDAIARSEITKAVLAEALEVTPGFVSQFASGHRPVPWQKAEPLAALLGLDPADISVEYRQLLEHFGKNRSPKSHNSQPQRLDLGKLTVLIETVDSALAKAKRRVPARTKAELVVALYRDDRAAAAASPKVVMAALAKILGTGALHESTAER